MKKGFTISVLAILFVVAFFTGCKKDNADQPIPESHIGRYVVSSQGFGYKYIEFSDDSVYFFTESGYYNMRSKASYTYTVSGDTINFQYGSTCTFSIQSGTLTLSRTPTFNNTITAERSSNVPSANTWVKPVSVTYIGAVNSGSAGTDRYSDMTSYYSTVVTDPHHNGSGYVFKGLTVNNNSYTATETPVDPLFISEVGYQDNVEFFNGKFMVYQWGNPNSYLYRVAPTTGIVENSVQVGNPVGSIYALATDGTSLFGMTYSGIRKFDFVNNVWGNELATGGAGTLAGRNGFLYFTPGNTSVIQKSNSTTMLVEGAFEIPDHFSFYGTAFLNDYTMLACLYDYNTTKFGLYLIYLN